MKTKDKLTLAQRTKLIEALVNDMQNTVDSERGHYLRGLLTDGWIGFANMPERDLLSCANDADLFDHYPEIADLADMVDA